MVKILRRNDTESRRVITADDFEVGESSKCMAPPPTPAGEGVITAEDFEVGESSSSNCQSKPPKPAAKRASNHDEMRQESPCSPDADDPEVVMVPSGAPRNTTSGQYLHRYNFFHYLGKALSNKTLVLIHQTQRTSTLSL